MSVAIAMLATVAVVVLSAAIFSYAFRQAVKSIRTVQTEPKRIDDTPWLRCPECGGVWIDSLPPLHDGNCPVAYIKHEDRRHP